ncbi:MAG TPA: hypothetical protein VGS22_16750 [Thermoanaerobaculia bacterium]|nr:hypothetical protein [Thermoanaerobaculia bacterium]
MFAILAIPSAVPTHWVEFGVDLGGLQPWHGGYYGVVEKQLPDFHLAWDGRPPRAEIVDRRTGEVLAPAVLSRGSLEANRNAVLWLSADAEQLNPERCEYVIETRPVRERGPFLALRFEAPPSAKVFHRGALLAVLLIGIAAVLMGVAHVVRAAPAARLGAFVRCCRSGLFLALAATSFVTHYPGVPWLNPETDVASINSFAAALDHPEAFDRDALLDQRRDFDWYIPLFVGLVRGVGRLGLPYSMAYAVLGFLGIWLSLVGYERLFSKLSRSALFGFVAALALVLLDASYPPNEHWSFSTVLPRSLFSALLPWVVLLALRWLGPLPAPSPGRWWIAAAAAAALFYVHPVSSPALSGALFIGFLVVDGVRLRARLMGVLAAGAVTILVMVPYAARYGAARQAAEGGGQGLQVLHTIIGPFEPQRFYTAALALVVGTPRYWVLLAGLVLLIAARRPGTRLFLGMLVGWGLVTFALPAFDWALAEKLGRQPFQFNLVRNLRYLDFWLLTTLALLARFFRRKPFPSLALGARITAGRAAVAARSHLSGAALIASVVAVLCYAPSVARTMSGVMSQVGTSRAILFGRWRAVPSARLEALWAVEAFRKDRETVSGARDLDFFRQFRIPLAYTWKDPETLSYAAGGELVRARRVVGRVEALLEPPVDPADAQAIRAETGAELLVIERWRASLALRESRSRLFLNDRYVVLRPSLDVVKVTDESEGRPQSP